METSFAFNAACALSTDLICINCLVSALVNSDHPRIVVIFLQLITACLRVVKRFRCCCVSEHTAHISVNVSCLTLTVLVYLHPGILTLTLTNPIWVTKTRLVLQYSADRSSKQYKGMLDALVKIYRHEGVSGLYKVGHHPNCFSLSVSGYWVYRIWVYIWEN